MKRALFVTGVLFLSSCRIHTDCTFEQRSVKTSGSLANSGSELVYAEISVSAVRGSLQWKTIDYAIRSEALKGHVTSITLVGVRNGSSLALPIPIASSTSYALAAGGFGQHEGESTPDLGGLYELLAANDGSLEIETDLPSFSHLKVPLTKTDQTDWIRPHTCY